MAIFFARPKKMAKKKGRPRQCTSTALSFKTGRTFPRYPRIPFTPRGAGDAPMFVFVVYFYSF